MELGLATIQLFQQVHLKRFDDLLSQLRHAIVFGQLCDIRELAFLRLMIFRLWLQAVQLILDAQRPLRVQFDHFIHLPKKLIEPACKRFCFGLQLLPFLKILKRVLMQGLKGGGLISQSLELIMTISEHLLVVLHLLLEVSNFCHLRLLPVVLNVPVLDASQKILLLIQQGLQSVQLDVPHPVESFDQPKGLVHVFVGQRQAQFMEGVGSTEGLICEFHEGKEEEQAKGDQEYVAEYFGGRFGRQGRRLLSHPVIKQGYYLYSNYWV